MKFKILGLVAMAAMMTACGGDDKKSSEDEDSKAEGTTKTTTQPETNTVREVATNNGDIKLAYIISDSVISSYKGFQEANKTIQKKQADFETRLVKMEQSLQARSTKLQNDYNSGNYVKLSDIQERQSKLERDQQSYAMRFQQERAELEGLAQRLLMVQQKDISDFIKNYGEENDYDMILLEPGGLIYAKKIYDITGDVINLLNKQYDDGVAEDLELEKVIADTL